MKTNLDQPATKRDLLPLEFKIDSLDKRIDNIENDISDLKAGFNEIKDDIAKTLMFLNEHFPIEQHQISQHTERIENHEIRIVRVEDQLHIQ